MTKQHHYQIIEWGSGEILWEISSHRLISYSVGDSIFLTLKGNHNVYVVASVAHLPVEGVTIFKVKKA